MPGSLHLVDPELRPLIEALPPVALTDELLPLIREAVAPLPPQPDVSATVSVDSYAVPGPAGAPDVQLAVYRPVAAQGPLPCIFHIHGGGYVAGSAKAAEPLFRPFAAELGCVIVSVDYRLAPETRFPGAIEDCYAGLAWVFRNAARLGIDSSSIGVMGESAGGGLAAALALLARDRGEYPVAFQALIYPMIDDRTCVADPPHPYAGEYVWTAQNNAYGWSSLLGQAPGSDGVSCYAAAARATDLSRLPPTYISTGALDLFLEEDVEYARRLTRAGVPVELHLYPGAYHGFDFFTTARIAVESRQQLINYLRRALRPVGQR
jgi:triacylglycerol lipase